MKKKTLIYFAISLFVGLILNVNSYAQEENIADNYKMIYKFKTVKNADNTRLLEVSFRAKNKEDRKDIVPVYDADIHFYNVGDTADIELGVVKTDNAGTASLTLAEDHSYITDEEGFINFKAVYKGSDAIKSEKKKLAVKDIFLDVRFEVIDSVNTVFLLAETLDSLNNRVPVEEVDVIFSVEGMISNMPIEDGTVENGEYEFEFPTDIRGDKNGIINVIVLIDDSDDYGNVIQSGENDWGMFDDMPVKQKNTLWSEAAPIWMYIVLSILLIGVWANFIYTMINLWNISKLGKTDPEVTV